MTITRIILMLALPPLLAGCAPWIVETDCPGTNPHVTLVATGGKENARVTSLRIAPDTIKVKQNCWFDIRFPGAAGKHVGTVGTSGPGVFGWLEKTDETTFPIQIKVPAEQKKGTYKYTIEVAGFGTLDPRVKVY